VLSYAYPPTLSCSGWLTFKIAWSGPDRVDAVYPCWAFLELRGGVLDVQLQGDSSSWEPRRAVVLPPFEVVTLRHRDGLADVSVLLVPSGHASSSFAASASGTGQIGAFLHDDERLIAETARAADVCWRSHESSGRTHQEVERAFGRAAAAAIHDARANVPRWQASSIVRRTKEVIDRRYTHSLRLDGLARDAGVSKYHLLRQFRRQVGMAPHAYQVAVRVACARELLACGHSAVDVAGRVGFYDQSAFTRAFKRAAGITPAAYASIVQRQPAGFPRLGSPVPVAVPYGGTA
jgi:AraC-like DNA-binding protein